MVLGRKLEKNGRRASLESSFRVEESLVNQQCESCRGSVRFASYREYEEQERAEDANSKLSERRLHLLFKSRTWWNRAHLAPVPPGGIVHTEAAWAQLGAKGFFEIKCSADSCQGAKGEADQGLKGEVDQGAIGHHVMLYF